MNDKYRWNFSLSRAGATPSPGGPGGSRWPVLRGLWPESSTAPETGQALRRFRITHPFHPLRGREFELIQIKLCWGIDRVYYAGEDSALRHVPVGWTSVAAVDPFVSVARGRSAFRVEDLLALAEAIDRAL